MSKIKMNTFDVHNDTPIPDRDSYSGFYRNFEMSYECMLEIRKVEDILKSEALLNTSLFHQVNELKSKLKRQEELIEELRSALVYYKETHPIEAKGHFVLSNKDFDRLTDDSQSNDEN